MYLCIYCANFNVVKIHPKRISQTKCCLFFFKATYIRLIYFQDKPSFSVFYTLLKKSYRVDYCFCRFASPPAFAFSYSASSTCLFKPCLVLFGSAVFLGLLVALNQAVITVITPFLLTSCEAVIQILSIWIPVLSESRRQFHTLLNILQENHKMC